MAGAGGDRAVSARSRGQMRASHADREAVIDTLKAAYVYGLVTKDEFDERVSETLTSRTHAELALVAADIPAGLAAAPPLLSPERGKANALAPAHAGPSDRAVGATAVVAALAFIAAFLTTGTGLLAEFLALAATGSGLTSMVLAAAQLHYSRRDRRSAGQFPPQGAINSGPGTGQLPPTLPTSESHHRTALIAGRARTTALLATP